MKKRIVLGAAMAGLVVLAGCHKRQDTTTVNTDANMAYGNMDAGMGNAADTMATGAALSQANATEAMGANTAADLSTHDHDTNLANGI